MSNEADLLPLDLMISEGLLRSDILTVGPACNP